MTSIMHLPISRTIFSGFGGRKIEEKKCGWEVKWVSNPPEPTDCPSRVISRKRSLVQAPLNIISIKIISFRLQLRVKQGINPIFIETRALNKKKDKDPKTHFEINVYRESDQERKPLKLIYGTGPKKDPGNFRIIVRGDG